jgi:RHS repeat-associated protein
MPGVMFLTSRRFISRVSHPICFLLVFALLLCECFFYSVLNSTIALAQQPDPYGFPAVPGTSAGETKGSFAVTDNGSASYKVGIKVPPGTNGMQPTLSIAYDSLTPNSYLGIGWNISGLSAITRCPATIASEGFSDPVDYDSNDKLCLDGQRLTAVNGIYLNSGTEYRTENEVFSKILSSGAAGNGPALFTVKLSNGLIYTYGNTADSKVAHNNGNILVWKLNRIEDHFGNYLTISYFNDGVSGENYPLAINYTGHVSSNISPYNQVVFEYEARPDVQTKYLSGKKLSVTKRLKKVLLFSDSQLAWEYRLGYSSSLITNRSQLQLLSQCDNMGLCLQPVSFTWKSESNVTSGNPIVSDQNVSGTDIYNPQKYDFGDFNGDGVSDIIYYVTPYKWAVRIANGNGTFGPPIVTNQNVSGVSSYFTEDYYLADFNGDGMTDIIHYGALNSFQWVVRLSNGDGTFGAPIVTNQNVGNVSIYHVDEYQLGDFNGDTITDIIYYVTPYKWAVRLGVGNGTFGNPVVTDQNVSGISSYFSTVYSLVDVNGDGLTDILHYGALNSYQWVVRLSNGNGNFGGPIVTNQNVGNVSIYQVDEYQSGDFNGDGVSDLIYYVSPYKWAIRLGIGDGTFGAPVVSDQNVGGVSSYFSTVYYLGDFNGDGLTDIIHYGALNSYQWIVRLSKGDGTFESPIVKAQNVAGVSIYDVGDYEFGDFNGDGITDLIYYVTPYRWAVRLTNSGQPLVKEVNSGYGAQTAITYSPLTDDSVYTKENTGVFPVRNIQEPLYVVSSFQSSDGIGGTASTHYQYTGLKIETTGRGLSGFRKIGITDDATGITTTTTYSQNYPFKALPIKTEVRLSSGTLISKEEHSWDKVDFSGGNYFVFLEQTNEQKFDLQGNLLFNVVTDRAYDTYGNIITLSLNRSDGWNETTTNLYYNNPSTWIIGRLTSSSVQKFSSYSPTQVRLATFNYDPANGSLITERIEPNSPTLSLTKTYNYDAYGNQLSQSISGPNLATRFQSTTFDQRGRFPISSTNPLLQTATSSYSGLFGTLISKTDPNGLVASAEFDSFGRETYQNRPDGTHRRTLHLVGTGMPAGAAYFTRVDETGKPPSVVYYDMLDREIIRHVLGFNGQWIESRTVYDSQGRVLQKSEPAFVGASNLDWTVNQYDIVGRITKVVSPGNRTTNTVYSGLTTIVTDPLKHVSSTTKNSLGNVVSVRDSLNSEMTYYYDNFENLTRITDSVGNFTSLEYDIRGNKTSIMAPDTGTIVSQYDALGQLTSQTDAKGQTVQFSYDLTGRMIQRNSPAGIAQWLYDSGPNAIGSLVAKLGETGAIQTHAYDLYGRLSSTSYFTPEFNLNLTISPSYDSQGRIASLTYPTGFAVSYAYNANGYLEAARRADTQQVIWRALAQSPRGQLEQFQLGNGLTTQQTYDPVTGFFTRTQTTATQDLGFAFDDIGNLTSRTDHINNLTEGFKYDSLNRLISSQATGQAASTVAYDPIGNIIWRSGVGSYAYGNPRQPHAVSSISGLVNENFSYDRNGNLTASNDYSLTYDSFNKATSITKQSLSINYSYDADHSPYLQMTYVTNQLERLKIYAGGVFEVDFSSSGLKFSHYLKAGSEVFGIYEVDGALARTLYLHKDHLGSIQSITNDQGGIVEVQSYDAWGQRRDPLTWLPNTGITSQIDRGYTGHEHLRDMDLVNTGGRIYNPAIGRFLTPDPFVQEVYNLQNLNRYTYVLNNPLSYTDPSGFFFKKLFRTFKGLISNPKSLAIFAASIATGTWVAGQVLTGIFGVGVCVTAPSLTALAVSGAAGSFASATTAGILSGNGLGDSLRGGLRSAVVGGASVGFNRFVDTEFPMYLKTGAEVGAEKGSIYEEIFSFDRLASQVPRVMLRASFNGGVSHILGGKFMNGFSYSYQADLIDITYSMANEYGLRWEHKNIPGLPWQKQADRENVHASLESAGPCSGSIYRIYSLPAGAGICNSTGSSNEERGVWRGEYGFVGWIGRNIPLINGLSLFHDTAMGPSMFDIPTNGEAPILLDAFNIGTILPSFFYNAAAAGMALQMHQRSLMFK